MTTFSKDQLVCRVKPYIQPFERRLALEEMTRLTGFVPFPRHGEANTATEFVVKVNSAQVADLARRLAYWESVSPAVVTRQCLREATTNIVRNGIDLHAIETACPLAEPYPLPNRRCLRYGPHGIHEYRGKFFPQLVPALLNIGEVPHKGLIADPMSGSGTTIVEAVLAEHNAVGLDMNPLSVYLGTVKCAALSLQPKELSSWYQKVRDELLTSRYKEKLDYFHSLPTPDQEYLSAWFSVETLQSLDGIVRAVRQISNAAVRGLMLVSLSNILRKVSWQKEDDLRVRREVRVDADIDPVKEYLEELGRSVRTVLAFLYQECGQPRGTFSVREGDARQLQQHWAQHVGMVDAVITSPPYATALPYLDTDRLSLCYLQLLSRKSHRPYDYRMIGNREVTEGLRRTYRESFARKKHEFPSAIPRLIETIERLNESSGAGFRRRNLPALLAKYFMDMRDVISGVRRMLKPGSIAFFVVGNNHTLAGGKRVEIETATLLNQLAESLGLDVADPLRMEMLVSRDIFRNNASESERILAWRNPGHAG